MKKILPIVFVMIYSSIGQMENSFDTYLDDLRLQFRDIPQFYADSSDFKNMLLFDAREKAEFETSKIVNAEWIGSDISEISRLDSIDRDTKIVVYCSVGYRSSLLVREMRRAGFNNTFNLYGGIFKWVNDGRLLNKDGTFTDKIHGYNRKWSRFIRNPMLYIVY